jgi:hypothetical protein
VPARQTEVLAVYCSYATFTDSTEPTLDTEAIHRDHDIIEQVSPS